MMRKVLSELLGTFGLVFTGCGAVVVNDLTGGVIGHLGINVVFGLAVMTMVYSFGDVSGAHINPAVTIAFWLSGRFPLKEVAPYVVAQCIGAIAASALLLFLFPGNEYYGATLVSDTIMQSFVLEVVITFLLMLIIIMVATGSKEVGTLAGIAIGAAVSLLALVGGPISGASMNPARSLGPALISGHLENLWLYVVAPIIGAALAVPVSHVLKNGEDG
ncbi:MAG: MIP family channel protein [Flavobacteriales bacterium]|jgi:aquaporin Z|nr:MIP family channel protein [Flavobacteriales bacterium]